MKKKNLLKKYDSFGKISQRAAATKLEISQPLLCKLLKNRYEIETACLENANVDRKRKRGGKDEEVGSTLKKWFSDVREKDARVNGPLMKQKAEDLAKQRKVVLFQMNRTSLRN